MECGVSYPTFYFIFKKNYKTRTCNSLRSHLLCYCIECWW